MNRNHVKRLDDNANDNKSARDYRDAKEIYDLANSLAHEIRNPLHALSLHLNLLAEEIPGGENHPTLAAARNEVKRLDELLTAFLRFARPQRLRRDIVNLADVLKEFQTFIAPEAAKRGVAVDAASPPNLAAATDGNLVKQALLNVVLNSFDAGARRVTVAAEAGPEKITIRVRDDGPGFTDAPKAMDPFYSTKPEGTGLGLPTARRIARALGGELRIGAPASGAWA